MKQNKQEPAVSIILAAYNEERTVAREIEIIKEALDKVSMFYEIIVVDDASTDRTSDILSGIKGIRIIRHKTNRGAGAARKTGTLAARGRIAVWTDVDMTYPNHMIPRLVEELLLQNLDQIVGTRDSEQGTFKMLRVPTKYFIRRLAVFLSRSDIPDLNSGMRAFKRDLALRYLYLVPDGFSCTSTMTLSFLCNGHSVGYLPVTYHKRVGKSKFHLINDTYNYIIQVVRMVMYFDPLRVFLPISLLILSLGLASSTWNVIRGKGLEQSDIIIFMAAIMVGVIGLLADLIVMQSKKNQQ